MINYRCENEACDIIKHLYSHGFLSTSIFAAVSIRDPQAEIIYISPSINQNFKIKTWEYLRPEDIVATDMNAKILKQYSRDPSPELTTHIEIYKHRPDMHSVIHIHSEYISAFCSVNKSMYPVMVEDVKTMIGGNNGIVNCASFSAYNSGKFTSSVIAALSPDKKAAFLHANGAICIGENAEEAYSMCTILERQSQMEIYATSLGQVNYINIDMLIDESIRPIKK